jgi:hypothetical protein
LVAIKYNLTQDSALTFCKFLLTAFLTPWDLCLHAGLYLNKNGKDSQVGGAALGMQRLEKG